MDHLLEATYKAFEVMRKFNVLYPHGLDIAYRAEYAARYKLENLGNGKAEKLLANLVEEQSGKIVSFI